MGGIDTPAAENNDRIIRKLCCLSDYWGRRKFLKRERTARRPAQYIGRGVHLLYLLVLGFLRPLNNQDVTEIEQATLFYFPFLMIL